MNIGLERDVFTGVETERPPNKVENIEFLHFLV